MCKSKIIAKNSREGERILEMADKVALIAIEFLVQKLEQDADLLHGMQDQVRTLVAVLRRVSSYFAHFEGKLNDPSTEMFKTVMQIKDKVYEAEKIIDDFITYNAQRRRRQDSFSTRLLHSWRSNSTLGDATSRIAEIEWWLAEGCPKLEKLCAEYAAGGGGGGCIACAHDMSQMSIEEAEQVIGFDNATEDLVAKLKYKIRGHRGRHRRVLGITGMEGSGKTTLAKKVYNHAKVMRHFTCRAWVRVSERYKMEEVLLCILDQVRSTIAAAQEEEEEATRHESNGENSAPRPSVSSSISGEEIEELFSGPTTDDENSHASGELQFNGVILKATTTTAYRKEEDISKMNEEELKETLLKLLRGRRYLIVMDDVCKKEVWDEVKPAFPNESNGSRILFTCRSADVASHAGQVYQLRRLSAQESWQLLAKRALADVDGGEQMQPCPPELEEQGRHLAEKCSGIPLAITMFGNILARKEKTVETWTRLTENASGYIAEEWLKIVSEYDTLPVHLKSCLLYFSMFPEDHIIPAAQLVQMWTAEGFIEERGDKTMEEIGEEYLEELINRSYVQVISHSADDSVKTCSILSLLRDLCIHKGVEQQFSEVLANPSYEPRRETPRLAIHRIPRLLPNGMKTPELKDFPRLRSLHYFGDSKSPTREFSISLWKSLQTDTTLLRVLNLGSVVVDRVPDSLGKLLRLRYLRINARNRRPGNTVLPPPSICNIRNLQTLDMRETDSCVMPEGIWKMQNLRHLRFGSCSMAQLDALHPLQKLQTLSGIRSSRNLKRLMVKSKFPNVTKLRLHSNSKSETLEFLESLDHLYYLQSLKVIGETQLPDPHAFPGTLTKVTLKGTTLDERGLRTLEKLPNLKILKLMEGAIEATEISCSVGAFPQLQILKFSRLKMKSWKVGRRGMRSLLRVVIERCVHLENIPVVWVSTIEVIESPGIPVETLRWLESNGCKIRVQPEERNSV